MFLEREGIPTELMIQIFSRTNLRGAMTFLASSRTDSTVLFCYANAAVDTFPATLFFQFPFR